MGRASFPLRRVAIIGAVVLLVGCSSGSAPATTNRPSTGTTAARSTTSTTSTASTSSSSSSPSSTSTSTAVRAGCTGGDGQPPAGAVVGPAGDVDGDGRADRAWIAREPDGGAVVGIATAVGGGDHVAFGSASPVRRTLLVVDVDRRPPTELLLDDGRSVGLDAFADCRIRPIRNPEGQPYAFSLGFTEVGTGVGCADTAAGRRLVGLDATVEPDGSTVSWSSTVVELDGLHARNGAARRGRYHLPGDRAAVDHLHDVTCGDRRADRDGLSLPR